MQLNEFNNSEDEDDYNENTDVEGEGEEDDDDDSDADIDAFCYSEDEPLQQVLEILVRFRIPNFRNFQPRLLLITYLIIAG